ncbi:hypothetical protein [Pseudomonas sp. TMP9]|uniref:hypothetical protein n=1 Tax=Pseudomonas sp. TMP9 TaxID=3133144 RepID=UPI0030CAAEEE
MDLTTQQLYAMFAMLSVSALAGLIFYCIGLRTGREAADQLTCKLTKHNSTLGDSLAKLTTDLVNVKRTLETREGALSKLRKSLIEEQRDHGEVERGLLNRLAAACPLSDEDYAVLIAMAAKLGLAADTFAGLNAHDHAKASRLFQTQALDMAERITNTRVDQQATSHAATPSDNTLIEWLNNHATLRNVTNIEGLEFDDGVPIESPEHLRSLLQKAYQNTQSNYLDDPRYEVTARIDIPSLIKTRLIKPDDLPNVFEPGVQA